MTKSPTTLVTVCETCRKDRSSDAPIEARDGAAFAALVEAQIDQFAGVEMRRFRCLMGCEKACNVSLQSDGKTAYVFDGFDVTKEDAQAVLTFAQHYSESADGVVSFSKWPDGIKGHFRSKIPAVEG